MSSNDGVVPMSVATSSASEGGYMPKSPRLEDSAAYMQVRTNEDTKVSLEWENINYFVKVKDSSRSKPFRPVYKNNHILNNVSGSAKSGQLLAIMGPTGCGKTSLLNVLAARMPGGGKAAAKLTGSVYVNGQVREDNRMRRISAYVLQDDKLYPHLTVYETLLLSAHFYLPESVTMEQKERCIDEVNY
jgi:ABC-type multidrug transport system ATPase subunit